jgi:hypothetical protein
MEQSFVLLNDCVYRSISLSLSCTLRSGHITYVMYTSMHVSFV